MKLKITLFIIIQVAILIFSGALSSVNAANYYWIGGAGNWSDINHWATTSGGGVLQSVVPSQSDDVIFDLNSGFTSGNNTVTINVPANCHDMTWIGALNTPTIGGSPLNVYGSWALQSNMVYSVGTTNFLSNSLGETITSNGVSVPGSCYFGSSSIASTGGWILQDGFQVSNFLTFNSGTLNTNNQSVNINKFYSASGLSRNLILGSSIITCSNNGGGGISPWRYTGGNALLDAGTSLIELTANITSNFSFRGVSGHSYYHILCSNPLSAKVYLTGGISIQKLTFIGGGKLSGNNTMDTLVLSAGRVYEFQSGNTQTVNNKLYASGNPCFILFLKSTGGGSQVNLNVLGGSVDFDYVNIIDINASGSYTTLQANSNSTDAGNNTNINFVSGGPNGLIGLGPDIQQPCPLLPGYTINTNGFFANPFTTFLWEDLSTADTLLINAFGQYSVTANYGNGCVVKTR